MRASRLLGQITLYYVAVAAAVVAALWLVPDITDYLPVGRAEALIASSQPGTGQSAQHAAGIHTLGGSMAWITIAIAAALITAWPVSWVYMAVRNPDDYDQSLVDTIIVLPIVVTSIVIIVQHSLALAFSLAGIAAAVRFRNTLKSSGDALFILLAVGIGLSAGIGAIELAAMMSLAFNYCFVLLWISRYGARAGMKKRYMAELDAPEAQAGSDTHSRPEPS